MNRAGPGTLPPAQPDGASAGSGLAEGLPSAVNGAADGGNRRALARLLAVVALAVILAIVLHGVPVLIVVLALVAMVMLHEGGHFAAAKLSGMKVTEYFLGFGPRVWSIRRGETEYGVKAIPAGGYVRIVGMTTLEEVDPADEGRSYRQATFPRRMLVAVAGSAMHFVIAFALLWAMISFSGLPVSTPTNEVTGLTSFVGTRSPAQIAGVQPGDLLLGVDGHRYSQPIQVVDFIEQHAGQQLTLLVSRDGRQISLPIRPVDGRHVRVLENGQAVPAKSGSQPVGVIGVDLGGSVYQTSNAFVALGRAGSMLGSVTAGTAAGIAQVFSFHGLGSFAHQVANAGHNVGSPASSASSSSGSGQGGQIMSIVGASELAVQAAKHNISELLYILVAINIFVGMINLFPMLPLDGGHVAIAVYERVRSRRGRAYHADVTKLMPIAYLFLAFMVVLGLGALYVNLLHPVSLPGG